MKDGNAKLDAQIQLKYLSNVETWLFLSPDLLKG